MGINNADAMNLQISAGTVYRFTRLDTGNYGFIDRPEYVDINEEVAARCEPSGRLYYIDESRVAEFVDPLTSEHYGQPVDDSDEAEASPE